MSLGGIEAFMMNYYRNIDRSKIQIDFVVHGFEKGIYDDEIRELGGIIYNVPIKSESYFANINELRNIFNKKLYKIVHAHMDAMNTVVLREAKRSGVPIRISHSHNTQHLTNSKIKYALNEYVRKRVCKYATHLFACSVPAAEWLYGKKAVKEGAVYLIKNAIDLDKYRFSDFYRDKYRKVFNVEDNFVIGHIGRFDYQKNHEFLINLFSEFIQLYPKAKLFLVGDGHLRSKIENQILKLGLSKDVIIAGYRKDINQLMNCFDVLCLPSKFEGLAIVLIEAQMNGLNCVASNTIPEEVKLTSLVKFVSLESNISQWIKQLYNGRKKTYDNIEEKIIEAGYSINKEAVKLSDLYREFLQQI